MVQNSTLTIRLFLLILLVSIVGCARKQKIPLKKLASLSKIRIKRKMPIITIWVHGTQLLPTTILKNYYFAHTGLNPVYGYDTKYHKFTIASTLSNSDKNLFPLEHFYIFGWSGKLSFEAREKAAQDLYDSLKKCLAHYYETYRAHPRIRIITHSHGGNVALNLVNYLQPTDNFTIAELILLACPVQDNTVHLINHPLFETIYTLYSNTDMLQIVDPQGLYFHHKNKDTPLLSKRRFPDESRIVQVQVMYPLRNLMHIEFIHSSFLNYLPTIIKTIYQWDDTTAQCKNHCVTIKKSDLEWKHYNA